MNLIENLKWRYATKKFDPEKKVSEQDLEKIKEAVQLSASSYGLQLYKVLVVENKELREKLRPASWGQSQVTDASHLLVFCNYKQIQDEHIDSFVQHRAKIQGVEPEKFKGYADFIKGKLAEQSDEDKHHWTARQTYIAMGNLLAACAELRIDACPIEGFDPAQYDEILGLSQKGLTATLVAPIGYRSSEDPTQHAAKVRRPVEELFEVV